VVGDYFFIAHWFPKIGVLEAAGWNAHQFHSATEFFADFGVYEVTLTVPRGWVVGATGRETGRRENADRTTTHRYRAEDVHDFAWTTSPDYVERRERFEGLPEQGLPPVDMRLLLQPEHIGQEARHFAATRAVLRWYGEWYGPYPYGYLTIVDPAWQSGADGMEYPTLFTAGSRWLAPRDVAQPESVTVHEAGHQWWYGIVATNEFEYAWMDEGINTFSAARVLAEARVPNDYVQRLFGGFLPWTQPDIPLSRATIGNRLYTYRPRARSDDQAMTHLGFPAPSAASRPTRRRLAVDARTVAGLACAAAHPRTPFSGPHSTSCTRRILSPSPASRRIRAVLRPGRPQLAVFDYAVENCSACGEAYHTGRGATPGEAVFPVDVLVTFEDGHQVREPWDGRARWRRFTYDRPSQVASAVVDPDRTLLLDVNYVNNSRARVPRAREAATKWSLKWLVRLQDFVLMWAFLV
jgi:hypothetical protein